MTNLELKNLFINLSSEAKKNAEEFKHLSYNQINWKPADSQWSIGECIEHLLRTNAKYITVYEMHKAPEIVNDEYEFNQTLTGRFILKSVLPQNNKKFKTSASFNPAGSKIEPNVVNDFLNQTNKLRELVNSINPSVLNKKISSPFFSLVRYNIGESFLIIANHNLRHIQQAKRVMQNQNFPAS